jgi:predicted ester cyclase
MISIKTRASAVPLALLLAMGVHGAAHAQSLNKENFREYLSALESVSSDVLRSRFYHRDFSISLGELTMDVDAILEYERNLSSLVDFHFEIQQIVADETGIAIDAIETFDVKQDGDVPNIGPARKGDQWKLHLNVFYGLKDGKILTIAANVLSVDKVE